MNILFFQNCISPHQMPYIEYLPYFKEINDIVIIVPEADLETRKNMGWNTTASLNIPNARIIIKPSLSQIEDLYKQYSDRNTWCMYSGINSFSFISKCFKLSLKYSIRRGIITEPPFIYKHPLWQHAIRFLIKDYKYIKYIDKLFVMGNDYIKYYRFWSSHWEVIPFIYCTKWIERKINLNIINDNKLKILYVGSLSHRKNVQLLLNASTALNKQEKSSIHIGIIGDGEEKCNLEKIATANKDIDIFFYGMKSMNTIPNIMEKYDILCLPSRHDGWGAVVNEALTLGLYVICTNNCGSKYLIEQSNNKCGSIFKSDDITDLCNTLKNCIIKNEVIKSDVNNRIEWARNNIHGKIVAQYFINKLKS